MPISPYALLLLYFSGFVLQSSSATETTYKPRIVNGARESEESVVQWQAGFFKNGAIRCGGSLISYNKVITAAHCVVNPGDSSLKLRIGATDAKSGKEYSIVSVRQYEGYRRTGGPRDDPQNDLKIVEFGNHDVSLGAKAVHINKDPSFPPDANTLQTRGVELTVSGYGRLSSNDDVANHLRSVSVPIVPYIVCKERYEHTNRTGQICAGSTEADSCQGDSGGGLWRRETVNNTNLRSGDPVQRIALYGIVSYGYGCAAPYSPGVYTRVSGYYGWIQETIATPPTPFSARRKVTNGPSKRLLLMGVIASALFVILVLLVIVILCYCRHARANLDEKSPYPQSMKSTTNSATPQHPWGGQKLAGTPGSSKVPYPREEVHWPM